MTTRGTGFGAEYTSQSFIRQRFANPSAWLDASEKGFEKSRQHFFGDYPKKPMFGYALEDPPLPSDQIKPPPTYPVVENSFANGQPVVRQVPAEMNMAGYSDVRRSDAHHFPNVLHTKNSDYWQPQRSASVPGLVPKVEHWKGPPSVDGIKVGRKALNIDLCIFGDRFDDPAPLPPPRETSLGWAKPIAARRISEEMGTSANRASTTGIDWMGKRGQPAATPHPDAGTINQMYRPPRGRYGATFHYPQNSVDSVCGEKGFFGTWTPQAPGLGAMHCPNKSSSSVW
jgi:hypothetical protein